MTTTDLHEIIMANLPSGDDAGIGATALREAVVKQYDKPLPEEDYLAALEFLQKEGCNDQVCRSITIGINHQATVEYWKVHKGASMAVVFSMPTSGKYTFTTDVPENQRIPKP